MYTRHPVSMYICGYLWQYFMTLRVHCCTLGMTWLLDLVRWLATYLRKNNMYELIGEILGPCMTSPVDRCSSHVLIASSFHICCVWSTTTNVTASDQHLHRDTPKAITLLVSDGISLEMSHNSATHSFCRSISQNTEWNILKNVSMFSYGFYDLEGEAYIIEFAKMNISTVILGSL